MYVPVSDPDYWNDANLRKRLEDVLAFLSDDVWSFHFSRATFGEQLCLDTDPRALRRNPDAVLLFSGGADSLCAAVEAVTVHGAKPALVSHWPAHFVDHRQKALLEHLHRRVPSWGFPRTNILVNKAHSRERDTTQRTRSFLYASLGAGVASALGISDVILADNGIVSLNLPINDQLLGTLASRSTHPKFVWLFNALIEDVLPRGPRVRNPLWNRTRAEALEVLKEVGLRELLQETNSCAHGRGLPNVTPHCGTCSQCIDRRFASIAAGMQKFDLAERYKTDIFRDPLAGNSLTMAESHVRFAREAVPMSDEDLFEAYPQLNDCILVDDPSPHVTAAELAAMVKRHAVETLRVVQGEVAKASQQLVQHTLPPTCLIQIAVERERREAQVETRPVIRLSEAEEHEFRQHRFKSRLVIQVTGQTEGRKSNVVRVDGAQVILPDAEFRLFVRLIVALYEAEDGFVARGSLRSGGGLAEEGIYFAEELDQAVGRLRWRLGPALQGLKGTQFVEVSRKRVRLSTHRCFVIVARERLLQHPDGVIRLLATRLPEGQGRANSPQHLRDTGSR
jgi:7-cyano-7-deazaguanine synthase in queuosine biosynthesis